MLAKSLRGLSLLLIAASLLSWSYFPAYSMTQAKTDKTYLAPDAPSDVIGTLFIQYVDPSGKLLLSSWLDPDGSDFDQYVWDNFTLPISGGSTETITEIDWIGGYDPLRHGAGGPVLNFSVDIYPSIPAGTEPAIANPPLVHYMTGGNAGETSIGLVGGIPMYSYSFVLTTPLIVNTGEKYWIQVEAFQYGTTPDWGFAKGTGGNAYHYLREKGAGGDIFYHSVPDDAAFTVLGLVPDTPTAIMISSYSVSEHQPVNTIIGELTAADPDPLATFTFSLGCAVAGADDGSFNIAGTNLRTSAVFNFETKSSYSICLRVTDQNALTFDQNFIIYVNNVNEAPTDISLSSTLAHGNQPIYTGIGVLTATDPDVGATFTFSLACATAGADDAAFNILGTSLRSSVVFNFTIQPAYNICLRVTDQGGLSFDKNFIITVSNQNQAPAPICLPITMK